MKTLKKQILFMLLALTIFLQSCTPDDSATPFGRCKNYFDNVPIVGGGTVNFNSFRNNRYKVNIPSDKSTITIKAEFKGTNGRIYILNSAGNSIKNSDANISVSITDYLLDKAGTYYVVLNTNEPSTYSLDICGDVSTVETISASKKSFDTQSMLTGGGTVAYNSWRNKHFTFEITEDDSYVDFTTKSKTTNCRMYILNSAGTSIRNSDVGTYEAISPLNLNKGIYSVVVCGEESKATNFDLAIYSKSGVVTNANNVNSTSFTKKTGQFSPGGGTTAFTSLTNPKFTFTVNTPTRIDVIANSAGLNCRIYLLNSAGNSISNSDVGISTNIEQLQLASGTYTVVMCGEKDKNGSFDVVLHSKEGTVSDLVPK
jgi:hypothetical protein